MKSYTELAQKYVRWARESAPPESLLTRYEIYAVNWGDDSTLKTFDEWLCS